MRRTPGKVRLTPPPTNLERMQNNTRLLDWDQYRRCCFATGNTEEIDQRVGLLEEYLWGLLSVLKERNRSHDEVLLTQLQLCLADETEERRFIEEDADLLPYHLFNAVTQAAIVELLVEDEERQRNEIVHEHAAATGQIVVQLENIDRMLISTEFFDSMFLKLCQTQPHWMWRRLTELEREFTECPEYAKVAVIEGEEAVSRRQLESDYVTCVATALEMRAFAEKTILLTACAVPEGISAGALMEDSAVMIQAAFRGLRVRRWGLPCK